MVLARVNDANLYYEITGDAEDRLVLVHGSWGNHANWDRVVPALAESFRVLTYDRRGHSQSEPSTGEGTFDQDVADLGALIRHLDFAPALIVGNSFGAIVVLGLATRQPDLFRGLSVHEPPLLGLLAGDSAYEPMLDEVNRRIEAVLELIRQGDAAGASERFVETVAVGPGGWAQLPPTLRQTFVENASTFLDESRDPDWLTLDLEALSRFPQPALLTQGDQSPPFFLAIISKIKAALPGANVRTLAGASHIPHVSHPHEFIETLAAFARQPASSVDLTVQAAARIEQPVQERS
jgi:pimeloyl-ACP methyl ester carboxylesterase